MAEKDWQLHLDRIPRTIRFEKASLDGAAELSFPLSQFSMLDQTKLPYDVEFLTTVDWHEVIDAIKTLLVRGAPAIGISGVAAMALAAAEIAAVLVKPGETSPAVAEWLSKLQDGRRPEETPSDVAAFWERFDEIGQEVSRARPTAVNLMWGVERALRQAKAEADPGCKDVAQVAAEVACRLFDLVECMIDEDEAANRAIGEWGSRVLAPHSRILTHCNAGSLATAFYGTALGVVYSAAEKGLVDHVYADETRPVGQGARLTSWELAQAGVPVTLICDNMAASLMAQGKIDAVFVGADRIAANGDTANKIGTYGVAVLAHHHGIPFFVAAPFSTIDISLEDGSRIPIEQRDPTEVLARPIDGVEVWNPAFDVTPAELICGIVTEHGVFAPHELHDVVKETMQK